MHDSNRATSCISQPKQVSNCRRGYLAAAEPESREDQLAGQSPAAHGVKCHVSCDMARRGAGAMGFFKKKRANLFRLRGEACDLRWLVFVLVSGTVVAPIEA